MIATRGGKAVVATRAYGYSDVIRNKVRSLTEDKSQKDALVLVVRPFSNHG
jgi:hypothetical protein